MFPKVNPTTTKSWKSLLCLADQATYTISDLFKKDTDRCKKYAFDLSGFYFDFSKNNISDEVLSSLIDLAKECGSDQAIRSLFNGEKINRTENRAVLHTELRRLSEYSEYSTLAKKELRKVEAFANSINTGKWKGYTGKKMTDIVNIGIGGSDLGPKMVSYALKPYWKSIKPHFISNIDAQQLSDELEGLNPETTLFIVASKTFTTQETMTNARSAKGWFLKNGGTCDVISKHFVAVSTNEKAVHAFGMDSSNMFRFWDWVGGRYSLWSSIGLSIACSVGYDNFRQLLLGAEKMDNHFRSSPFKKNIPVIAALIGIWHTNFMNYDTIAILPYDHRLRFLPPYLQQVDMESNGKSMDRNGEKVSYQTGPVVWGETGTNGQHAFYQLIHQGTKIVPCDFIAIANPANTYKDHHDKLMANFFAQPEALLGGKTESEVMKELKDRPCEKNFDLLPFKIFEGNRSSTSILIQELSPFNMGMLIAFYEHKIFTQGVIWNIFSFDQWGVELGKQLAKPVLTEIQDKIKNHDDSTKALLKKFQDMRR